MERRFDRLRVTNRLDCGPAKIRRAAAGVRYDRVTDKCGEIDQAN